MKTARLMFIIAALAVVVSSVGVSSAGACTGFGCNRPLADVANPDSGDGGQDWDSTWYCHRIAGSSRVDQFWCTDSYGNSVWVTDTNGNGIPDSGDSAVVYGASGDSADGDSGYTLNSDPPYQWGYAPGHGSSRDDVSSNSDGSSRGSTHSSSRGDTHHTQSRSGSSQR